MNNYDLCDRSCYCNRCTVPLSCIECPIRHVKINCLFNAGGVDYQKVVASRQTIAKMRLMSKRNNKFLSEFCRKNCCAPDVVRQILRSKPFSQNSCERDPFNPKYNKFPNIFGTQPEGQAEEALDEDDVFTRNLLNQLFDETNANINDKHAEKKEYAEPNQNWVDKLYDLYSTVAGAVMPEQMLITDEQLNVKSEDFSHIKTQEAEKVQMPAEQIYRKQTRLKIKHPKSQETTSVLRKHHKLSQRKKALISKVKPKLEKRTEEKDPYGFIFYGPFDKKKQETWDDTTTKRFLPTITAKTNQATSRSSDAEKAYIDMSVNKTSFKREYSSRANIGDNLGYGDGQ